MIYLQRALVIFAVAFALVKLSGCRRPYAMSPTRDEQNRITGYLCRVDVGGGYVDRACFDDFDRCHDACKRTAEE